MYKIFLLTLLILPFIAFSQQAKSYFGINRALSVKNDLPTDSILFPGSITHSIEDSIYYIFKMYKGICKGQFFKCDRIALGNADIISENKNKPNRTEIKKTPFLTLHGDVMYDFFYRSAIDTPFADNDVMQHTIRANIYATIKNLFPVIIQVNSRQSNSYLFRNYVDANIQFDGKMYQSNVKEQLKSRMSQNIFQTSGDSLFYHGMQKKYELQQEAAQWLQNGRQLQSLIESRQVLSSLLGNIDAANLSKEAITARVEDYLKDTISNVGFVKENREKYEKYNAYAQKLSGYGSTIKGLSNLRMEEAKELGKKELNKKQNEAVVFLKEYASQNEKYKKYSKELEIWQNRYDSSKKATKQKIDSLKQIIDETDDPEFLDEQMKKQGLDSNRIYKWYKHLMAIKNFSIGRSMVDYSELTAKNISITGVNGVYENKIYVAVAAGTVDYRYRDFIVKKVYKTPQHLLLARIGIGKTEQTHIIATVYRGTKQASFFDNNNRPLTNKIFGISLEGAYRINKYNSLIAEVAKSTYPQYAPTQNTGQSPSNKSVLGDRSNEAYNIQLVSYIPYTDTKLYGQYKKLGINFQSYNIFNYNSNYSAWQLRAEQYFFRKAFHVLASVKTNEYNSPYTIYNYKSNTIFTTAQLTLRLKKWPILTAAYMPASQLYKSDNEIIETRFHTLMASANYMYKVRGVYMHSSVMYNRFFNQKDQQGFVYYNSTNWLVNHNVMAQKLTLNSAASLSYNTTYKLTTLDEGFNYQFKSWLRMGAGVKWNQLNKIDNKIGYYGNSQIRLKKLGLIELSAERGFLPGLDSGLMPNNTGRVIYFKTF